METTLHRELKALYGREVSQQEVTLGTYRVDAVVEGRLVEIQHGSLAAIRDKVRQLLVEYRVLVVKPIAARTFLVKRRRRSGQVDSRRYSPTRRTFLDLFDDLVHFVDVFPHPNLTLEVLLTEQEEHRVPVPRRRWFSHGYRVQDRRLRAIVDRRQLRVAADLLSILPARLTGRFTTAEIASQADIPRWLAQKTAYCLRKTGAADAVGKHGNAIVYELAGAKSAA